MTRWNKLQSKKAKTKKKIDYNHRNHARIKSNHNKKNKHRMNEITIQYDPGLKSSKTKPNISAASYIIVCG